MPKRLTQEEFIERANKINSRGYDLSHIKYTGSMNKIDVLCQKHGMFHPIACQFLNGTICKKCRDEEQRMPLEEFIERSNKIHKNKYNYSLVDYQGVFKKIKIICPIHGTFEQLPSNHLLGYGCKECGTEVNKLTQEEFIERSNKIHNNKYDYSLVDYVNCRTKVKIICKRCDKIFEMAPQDHLDNHGCSTCEHIVGSSKNKNCIGDKELFIKKAKAVHGDKYDYSFVEYINRKTPVKIVCPEHGEFWQKPRNHTKGYGCRRCKQSMHERIVNKWLYDNKIVNEYEKYYPDLKDILPLSYDFYLPDYNLLIECNGRQHYEPVQFNGKTIEEAKEDFEIQKRHDKLKEEYARSNKINLLIIGYKEIDDTEKILNEKLLKKVA